MVTLTHHCDITGDITVSYSEQGSQGFPHYEKYFHDVCLDELEILGEVLFTKIFYLFILRLLHM